MAFINFERAGWARCGNPKERTVSVACRRAETPLGSPRFIVRLSADVAEKLGWGNRTKITVCRGVGTHEGYLLLKPSGENEEDRGVLYRRNSRTVLFSRPVQSAPHKAVAADYYFADDAGLIIKLPGYAPVETSAQQDAAE